jgi:hypothetical protein
MEVRLESKATAESSNSQPQVSLITDLTPGESAKKNLYVDYFRPLARQIDTHPEWVFIHIVKVYHAIRAIMDSSDDQYIELSIQLFNLLLSAQDLIATVLINPAENLKDLIVKLDRVPVENKSWIETHKLTEVLLPADEQAYISIRQFNQELSHIIERCVKFYTPYHPKIPEEKLDDKATQARATLRTLKISSYYEIVKLGDNLNQHFNKKYFIQECLNILNKPAEQAVSYFKRLFLTLDLAILIIFKLVNQFGRNGLSGNGKFKADISLVGQLVNLEFTIDSEKEYAFNIVFNTKSFHQRNLFSLAFHVNEMFERLTAFGVRSLPKATFTKMMAGFAEDLLPTQTNIRRLIKKLDEVADLNELKEMLPSRLNYFLGLINETQGFFNNKIITAEIEKIIATNSNRKFHEDSFFEEIKTSVIYIIHLLSAIADEKTASDEVQKYFDFEIKDNKIQLKTNLEEVGKKSARFIDRDLLCRFLNDLSPKDQEDKSILAQNLIALDYIITSLDYCFKYDDINTQHEVRLTALNLAICGPKKSVVAIKSKKPDTPKSALASQACINESKLSPEEKVLTPEESFKQKIAVFKKDYADYQQKIKDFEQMLTQLVRPMMIVVKDELTQMRDSIKTLAVTQEIITYSPDNLSALTAACNQLQKLQTKMNSLLELIKSQLKNENDHFQMVHNQVELDFKDYKNKVAEAEKILRSLKAHATVKSGHTNKPLFPDYDESFTQLSASAQSIPEALKLTGCNRNNMATINAAQDNLKEMQKKLNTLAANLSLAENYFLGQTRVPGKPCDTNHARSSRRLG